MPTYRLNVEAANFPLLSYWFGPSVVLRSNRDSDYVVTDSYTGNEIANKEIGICQPWYMHNVMPTSYGYESIGFRQEVAAPPNLASRSYNRVIMLRNAAESRHYLGLTSKGRSLLFSAKNSWMTTANPGNAQNPNAPATVAYLSGKTYVAFENEGVYEYDTASRTMQPVLLSGLNAGAIKGITSSSNFLIAYDSKTVYWSDALDPLSFTPSLQSTASSSNPQTLRGAITVCLPIANGFIVYTTHNAVAALWTGNIISPWTFREIPNSAGVTNAEHVSSESNYGQHFAWTTSGLQIVEPRGAESFEPGITDYIAKRYFEQWTGVALEGSRIKSFSGRAAESWPTAEAWNCKYQYDGVLSKFPHKSTPRVKVSYVGSRFLAISIGTPVNLRVMLVYDIAYRRWGKLMLDHTDVFEYSEPGGAAPEALRSFGILQADGTIKTLDRDVEKMHIDSVFIFGRVTVERNQDTEVEKVSLATGPYDDFDLTLLHGTEARTIGSGQRVQPTSFVRGDLAANFYPTRVVAKEHALMLRGKFQLSGLELKLKGHPRAK
jgi:hypothetical protein